MTRLALLTAITWFLVGCAGLPTPHPLAPAASIADMRDGHYDNNTFLVRPRKMSLNRVIESLYRVRTEVEFRLNADGRKMIKSMEGTAVALFGKYLLTVEHVVSLGQPTVATPVGRVTLAATKIGERTFLEHRGRRYPLERLVADKDVDVALFRLPPGLNLKSFPYRIGNSDDLEVGNYIYLIGNPMNFGINVREGIVSSLNAPRVITKVDSIAANAFMVSNGLNPGDSGTPVIAIRDGNYELVGLSQGSFVRSQRLGWVIRINTVLQRIRSSLGVQFASLSSP